jgi:Mn2+/Fe2+ NRAMP family transporter
LCSVVSVAIIIATAAAIGGQGPLSSATQAAQALRPAAGAAAENLFAIGLLGAAANTPTNRRIATVCVATIAIMATIVATQALIGLA